MDTTPDPTAPANTAHAPGTPSAATRYSPRWGWMLVIGYLAETVINLLLPAAESPEGAAGGTQVLDSDAVADALGSGLGGSSSAWSSA